jgi:flagellar export protein FliJ
MKRFHFSLQPLLTLRQRNEQSALEKYAQALLVRQRALEQVDIVHRKQSESWNRWRAEVKAGCAAAVLTQWHACERNLAEQRQQAEAALRQAELAVNQTLQQALATRREREAVEKHLQKEHRRYKVELNREEQKALDDLAHRHFSPLFHSSKLP